MLGYYEKRITEVTKCSEVEATVVEEIMRSSIFHSTLDWQTVEEFEAGARLAYHALKEMRENGTLPESYQRLLDRKPRGTS